MAAASLITAVEPLLLALLFRGRFTRFPDFERPTDLIGPAPLAVGPCELLLQPAISSRFGGFDDRGRDPVFLNQPIDDKVPLTLAGKDGVENLAFDETAVGGFPAHTIAIEFPQSLDCRSERDRSPLSFWPRALMPCRSRTPSSGNNSRAPK